MQVNDVKDIYNHTANGKPILEGKAKLRTKLADARDSVDGKHEYWEVVFVDDGHVADRWIERTADDKNKEALDSFFAKNI